MVRVAGPEAAAHGRGRRDGRRRDDRRRAARRHRRARPRSSSARRSRASRRAAARSSPTRASCSSSRTSSPPTALADARRALPQRGLSDPHADRDRSGPPVPAPAQQEPQPRRHVHARGGARAGLRRRAGADRCCRASSTSLASSAERRARRSTPSCCSRTSSRGTSGRSSPASASKGVYTFRVTRNFDLEIDEEEAEDLLQTIQQELRRRERGNAVRLEVAGRADAGIAARSS